MPSLKDQNSYRLVVRTIVNPLSKLNPTRIKAVFFDFGGTLYDVDESVTRIWAKTLRESGLSFREDDFYCGLRKARAVLDEEMERRIQKKQPKMTEQDWIQYHQQILNHMGIDDTNSKMSGRITERLNGIKAKYSIISGAKSCLFSLRREYRLGIISNVTSDIRPYLKNDGIIDAFDVIGLSCEVGFWKPDKEIFLECCKRIGVEPMNSVYVGDSLNCDAKASFNVGMTPVLIGNSETNDAGFIKIGRVSDLLRIFGKRGRIM